MAHHPGNSPSRPAGGSQRSYTPDSSEGDEHLPLSVRGAPPELRRIIRKRQNSEVSHTKHNTPTSATPLTRKHGAIDAQSAKRCRERKKLESARTAEGMVQQAAKVRHLEVVVAHLARRLEETHAMLAALVGPSARPVPHAPAALCRNGQHGCGGGACAMCVRELQTTTTSHSFGGKIPGPDHAAWRRTESPAAQGGAAAIRRQMQGEAVTQGNCNGAIDTKAEELEGRSW